MNNVVERLASLAIGENPSGLGQDWAAEEGYGK